MDFKNLDKQLLKAFIRLVLLKLLFCLILTGLVANSNDDYIPFLMFFLILLGVILEFKFNYKIRGYHYWLLSDVFVLPLFTLMVRSTQRSWLDFGYFFDFIVLSIFYMGMELIAYGLVRLFFIKEDGVEPVSFKDRFDKLWIVVAIIALLLFIWESSYRLFI